MSKRLGIQMVMLTVGSVVLWFVTGCQEPTERLNAPPQGAGAYRAAVGENFVHMQDNAMVSDMSISPCHFVPHTTELNTLGLRRLNRYAEILDVYGGTLHYDGFDKDEEVRTQRIDRVKNYLLACGLASERFLVDSSVNGGKGNDATLGIKIRTDTNFGGEVELTESSMGFGK